MLNPNSEGVSLFRLRWIGYGLLLFSVLDSIDTLTPLQLMNPDWERQTFGALVERTPLLLMGLGLILNGEAYRRKKLETIFLKLISWSCLLLMVFFFLLIPFGIVSSFRVYNQSQQVVNTRLQQNLSQLKLTEERVRQSSETELKDLVQQLRRNAQQTGQPIPDVDAQDPKTFRQRLLTQLKVSKTQVEEQAAAFRGAQQRTLTKDAIKWTVGSLIVSILCFMFWQSSAWVRRAGLDTIAGGAKPKPSSSRSRRKPNSQFNTPSISPKDSPQETPLEISPENQQEG